MNERDLLSAYVDEECTAEERALVDEFLARDASWRAELDDVRAARRAVRELPWRDPPPGFVEALLADVAPDSRAAKLRRRVTVAGSALGTAAAAIVAVLLVVGGSEGDVAPAVASLAGVAGAPDSAITPVSAPIDLQRAAQKYDIERKVFAGAALDEVRRDGRLVARVYAEEAAGALRVEMFDEAGSVSSGTVPSRPAATTLGEAGTVDWDVHDPGAAGDNFRLVQRRVHEGGIVELSYSDGVLSVTVLEQHGELDWDDVPEGGVPVEVAGAAARRYTTRHGDVWVFERDNVVYTCVGRVPADELVGLVAEIAG